MLRGKWFNLKTKLNILNVRELSEDVCDEVGEDKEITGGGLCATIIGGAGTLCTLFMVDCSINVVTSEAAERLMAS